MQCKNTTSGGGWKSCHSLLADVAHPLETCGPVGQELSGVGVWRQCMVG